MRKKVLIILVSLLLLFGVWWFAKTKPATPKNTAPAPTTAAANQSAQIVSTNPDPLDQAIIPAGATIKITFNEPIQNSGEFKLRIEPKAEVKVELSADRLTANIIPVKPYELGQTYTIFIGTDTKFDKTGEWGQEKIFHVQTIRYNGV